MKILINGKETSRNYGEWLNGPLNYLKRHCREEFTLTLSPTCAGKRTSYYLEHRKAKTVVLLEKHANSTTIKAYRNKLPNIEAFIIPPKEKLLEETFSLDNDDYAKLVGAILLEHLGYQSIYYKGLYTNKKVSVTDSPCKEYPCYGGKILEVEHDDETTIVIIESGMQYRLPRTLCKTLALKPHNYLLMKHDKSFDVIPGIEFPTFFQLA